jgi:hypothetical protein
VANILDGSHFFICGGFSLQLLGYLLVFVDGGQVWEGR